MNQNPLKQRLVGAIVLVALGVIFIPLFLSGERDDGAPLFGSSSPTRPEVLSTMDKQVLDHAVPAPTQPTEIRTLVDEHTSDKAVTPKPVKPLAAKPPATPDGDQKSNSAKSSGGAKAPAVTSPTAWVVQIGSFSDKNNALKLRDKVRGKGFRVFVESVTTSKGRVFRVRVGPEVARAKAEELQTRLLKKAKVKGMVVSHP